MTEPTTLPTVSVSSPVDRRRLPRLTRDSLSASLSAAITRDYAIGAVRYPAVGLLSAGLWGAWLQPVLSEPLRAAAIPVELPFGSLSIVTWGLLVAAAILFAVVGLLPWGRRQPVWTDLSAVLSMTSTVGFLIQSALVDGALQARLARDRSDLASLQLIVGYRIPRADITTLGPIPLPDAAADVFSALGSGFFLALAGAVLMSIGALAQHRSGLHRDPVGRRVVLTVSAVVVVAIAASVIDRGLGQWDLARAQAAAADGDDQSAVALYESAQGHGNLVGADPDLAAQYGISQLRHGPADGPAAGIASSRLQVQVGKDLDALQTLADAAQRWPADQALRDEFTAQAFAYLKKRQTPQPVRALLSAEVDSPLIRVTLAKYELAGGDNPTATADAHRANEIAGNDDLRSVALTYLSVAQSRSGDLIEGRRTLLAAVDADKEFVNVMARSLLTGLYTTLPL
jgi:hypothetical protein